VSRAVPDDLALSDIPAPPDAPPYSTKNPKEPSMIHAREMSAETYAAAKRQALQGVRTADLRRREAADIRRIRAKFPELAAAGNVASWAAYRAKIKLLISAESAMTEADAARRRADGQPSLLIRERAAERLAAAVTAHDD
jgi:hypothetical protein